MFQFTGFPTTCYGFTCRWQVKPAGSPHSEISGSKDMCSYPELIAAYHVFHRLSVPRHPPCALSWFISNQVRSKFFLPWFIVNKSWFRYLISFIVCMKFSKNESHQFLMLIYNKLNTACAAKHWRELISLKTGSHLISHAVPSIVPSAAFVLTIVFGMLNGCFPKAHRHRTDH